MREDWIEIELGEIAKIYNGNSINARLKKEKYTVCKTGLNYIGTKDIAFDGRIEYENGVKIPIDEPKFKIAPKGCVLVCSEGGSAGRKIGYLDEDVCFGNKLYAITNEYSAFEGIYIYYYTRYRKFFQAFKGQLNGIIGGVSAKKFSNIKIDLSPLPEQRAIVSKIEELFSDLDKGIADLSTAQEQLKVYRQAVLKKAFEGELTKEWREKQNNLPEADELLEQIKEERQKHYEQQLENWKQAVKSWEENGKEGKKPGKPKSLKQFEISEDVKNDLPDSYNVYSWITLGNLLIESPQNGLYEPASKYGSGTTIIRIDNFYDGVILKEEGFKRVQLSEEDIQKYSINENEILINRVNSIEYLGKCGLVKQLDEITVFESNIMRLKLLNTLINSNYITLFLSSVLGEKEIRRFAKHAVNQASINQTDVSITPIPICSLKEQNQLLKEIESRLSVCDKVEQSITESLEKAKALRQSILKKAFEGTLLSEEEIAACKAAPDYEPASVLLEKIKAVKKK